MCSTALHARARVLPGAIQFYVAHNQRSLARAIGRGNIRESQWVPHTKACLVKQGHICGGNAAHDNGFVVGDHKSIVNATYVSVRSQFAI